jgi:hypothetical protein
LSRALALALALIALLATPTATASQANGAGGRGTPTRSIGAIRICSNDSLPRHVGRYRYLILNAWNDREIARIKAQNPRTTVLVYKDMATSRDDAVHNGVDLPLLSTGVGYAYANRHHPEWFLKDTKGARVNYPSSPHSWQMDVGSESYQQAWLRNVGREVRARHWDGVFIDGVSAKLQYPWFLNGRVLAKYPSDADYERATTSFLRQVGPALKRRGFLVVPNVNDATFPLWRRWVGYTSGAVREWWTKSGTGREDGLMTGNEWSAQLTLLREAEKLHKIFIGITYGPRDDTRSMRYARASFLLAARSDRSAVIYSAGCGTESWSPQWTQGLGAPRGPAFPVGPGAWRRNFTRGTVLVNASPSAAVGIRLGSRYQAPDGSVVASVDLQPRSGLLLRRP